MSAISLIMKLNLGEKDYEIFDKIKLLMKECEDVDHKKSNNDDKKEENTINESIDFNKINELMINTDFEEYLKMIYNRGKDNFEIYLLNENNYNLEDCKEKIQKMKYKELFDFIISNQNMIIINSYLNLFNDNNKKLLQDSESKNILQFNGEIYNDITEINKDNIKKDDNTDKRLSLFKVLDIFTKENKIEDINKYVENFFNIYNNLESDHAFYFHDNINKQILISRDIFGKRSIILYYIKFLSIIIFTPVLSETLIDLYKFN